MPKKKPTPAPAPLAPEVRSAAPGYDPYARGPAPPGAGVTAPGGPYGPTPAPGAAPGPVAVTAPPPREAQADFINATFLWQFGRPVRAQILGLRDATGTGKEFAGQKPRVKRAWFLDFKLEAPHPTNGKAECTGRINEGDTRHQRLWAAYQDKWQGRTVVLRLTTPGDIDGMTGKPSKAAWMLDAQ